MNRARIKPLPRQRGLALVLVLWTITLLAVIAGSFAYSMRTGTFVTRNAVDIAQARYLAEAGVQRALLALLDPDPAQRWAGNGSVRAWSFGGGVLAISVRDEAGLIDLNRAPPELLDGILRVGGVPQAARPRLVDAILDWRDADHLNHLHGAEDKAYRLADRAYAAKDAPFEAVEELQLVLGMPVAVFEKLEPFLTVYSGQGGVNQSTAPREVLLALPNADADTVDSLLAARTSAGGDGEQASAANHARQGNVYRITVHAQMPSGTTYGVRAVVQLSPTQTAGFLVREWKEGV